MWITIPTTFKSSKILALLLDPPQLPKQFFLTFPAPTPRTRARTPTLLTRSGALIISRAHVLVLTSSARLERATCDRLAVNKEESKDCPKAALSNPFRYRSLPKTRSLHPVRRLPPIARPIITAGSPLVGRNRNRCNQGIVAGENDLP